MPTMLELTAAAILALAAGQDLAKRSVSNLWPCGLLLCGMGGGLVSGVNHPLYTCLLGLLIVGAPVLCLATILDHGRAIGGGDVKIAASLGCLLGPVDAYMVLALSSIALASFGLLSRKKALPFCPFLFLSYLTYLIVWR